VKNRPKRAKIGSNWAERGQKWLKMAENSQKWSKMIKNEGICIGKFMQI
jgi:hypothetical protein